jgi:beta-fructofuranosidase
MKTWTKHPGNPVIATRPRGDLVGFRDPFAWREDDLWYMLVGSGIKGEGGTALLYRSADLVEWECLNPLCVGFGEIWECPNFFPLGDRHALVVSPHGSVKYSIGDYVGHRFTPGPWRELDLGGESGFYAPNCLEDGKGRRIMWGWIGGGGAEGYPWNGLLTLPRVLTLRADGRLGIEPAEELRSLRGEHHRCGPLTLTPTSPNVLGGMKGDCLEIIAEFEPGDARLFGLEVLRSPDGKEKTVIGYDRSRKRLALGDKAGDFDLVAGEETLRLLVFVDRSVVEVYANGRECMTNRAYPGGADSLGLSLFAEGGSVRVRSLAIWRLKSIW